MAERVFDLSIAPTLPFWWTGDLAPGIDVFEAYKLGLKTGRDTGQVLSVLDRFGFDTSLLIYPTRLINAEHPTQVDHTVERGPT